MWSVWTSVMFKIHRIQYKQLFSTDFMQLLNFWLVFFTVDWNYSWPANDTSSLFLWLFLHWWPHLDVSSAHLRLLYHCPPLPALTPWHHSGDCIWHFRFAWRPLCCSSAGNLHQHIISPIHRNTNWMRRINNRWVKCKATDSQLHFP